MRAPAVWGIVGVLALLAQAIYKLTPYALELVEIALDPLQVACLAVWLAINAYSEGWRGFHRMFAPRVVARARCLDADPRPLFVALAPLFVMGMLHATRKRLIVSWTLALGIVAIVVVVRQLAQPWRGIVDAGVVVGLAIGVVSILYHAVRALRGHPMPVAPDLPKPDRPGP